MSGVGSVGGGTSTRRKGGISDADRIFSKSGASANVSDVSAFIEYLHTVKLMSTGLSSVIKCYSVSCANANLCSSPRRQQSSYSWQYRKQGCEPEKEEAWRQG